MIAVTLRVVYPLSSGRIVLRTDHDWDADVEAERPADGAIAHEFRVRTDREFFYFKPCIQDASGLHWAVGRNYLALTRAASTQECYPHFFGAPRGTITEPIQVPSRILGAPRSARVYQPPGYAENTLKRYPVLYMHDGRNLFFPDEAFAGVEWRVDETMDLLNAMCLVDKAIVVGLHSPERETDYTEPGYERYARFVVEELKPWVEASFRALGGPGHAAVMGSSLGGVAALHMAWRYPDAFGQVACLSCPFGYRDDLASRVAAEAKRALLIYLDSGWPGDNYEATRAMGDLLVRRGYEPWRELLYLAFPEALHDEAHWGMRCHIPFQFFFGRRPDAPRPI
jgi:predicted alpha/beta superfamily hydrolase